MSDAHLAIVLHAHLPFVHHPEHKTFLEEEWFFEAVTETYVPILLAWNRLSDEGVPFRVTMSLTPTLLEMFANPLLKQRCRQYLDRRIELAQKEARHTGRSAGERAVALHYLERFRAGARLPLPQARRQPRRPRSRRCRTPGTSRCSPPPRRTGSCR